MSKLRKLLIVLLSVCMTVCLAIALAACTPGGPGYYNPDDDPNGEFKGNYVLTMQSLGGMGLSGIQVQVKKDGESKFNGISETNGQITFTLTPDVYEIVIDESTIPEGYSRENNTTITTKKDEAEVIVKFTSSVISTPAPTGTNYAKGDVMHDFTFKDVDGNSHTLSTTLKTKKAVVINFWGTQCVPCVSEFPALQKAYESYSDKLEIFALSSYTAAQGVARDTVEKVKQFQEERNITFPMGIDHTETDPTNTSIYTYFSLTGYPTTVIIDRYGVIAYRLTGSNPNESAWEALFSKYTSDNYSQDIGITEGNDGEIIYEECPKTVKDSAPDSAAIVQAISTQSSSEQLSDFVFADDPLSWPWLVERDTTGNSYLTASNKSAKTSYAVLNFTISLSPLQGIEFKYNSNTLSSNNVMYLIMDGKIYWYFSGNSNGWKTVQIMSLNDANSYYYSRSSHKLNVTLVYEKDDEVSGDAYFMLDDINLFSVPDKSGLTEDYAISVVDGQTLENGKYTGLNNKIIEKDNLLYFDKDGNGEPDSLLVVDINELTNWTDLHIGKYYFETADGSIASSLYNITWYFLTYFGENVNGDYDEVLYDPDYKIFLTYNLQNFSENAHVPVTTELRDVLIEFTKAVYDVQKYPKVEGLTTDKYYEDQWLELCFYFQHYGNETHEGRDCYRYYNPLEGFAYDYAYVLSMNGEDEKVISVDTSRTMGLNYYAPNHMEEAGGGIKYKFTPEKDGVYAFYSSYEYSVTSEVDPQISIIDFTTGSMMTADDDLRNTMIVVDGRPNFNFYTLMPMYAGHEYGIAAQMADASILGEYDLHIEYVGESAEMTVACTTGAGFWTWLEDENGNPLYDNNGELLIVYIATKVGLDSGIYRLVNEGDYGDPVYIDFINYNFYGTAAPLKTLIENDFFSKVKIGDETKDYTAYMTELYEQSLEVDEDDWRYGLTVATEELVKILSAAISETVVSDAWQQFAVYRQTFTTLNNAD